MKEEHFENRIEGDKTNLPSSIIIEVGSDLAYLLNGNGGVTFTNAVSELRSVLMKEWGIQLPPFDVVENTAIEQSVYRILMFDKEQVKRKVSPGKTLIITDEEKLARFVGLIDSDPIYSRPCVWVEPRESPEYYQSEPYIASVDKVILEHLESMVRANVRNFVTADMVKNQLEPLYLIDPEKVRETLRKISFTNLVTIMKNLVSEGIPLTKMDGIIRTISTTNFRNDDPDSIAEILRNLLKDSIRDYVFKDPLLLFVIPDSRMQLWFFNRSRSKQEPSDNDPISRHLIKELTNLYLAFHQRGFRLGVICCSSVRLQIRRILEKHLPNVVVLKPEEIQQGQTVKVIKKVKYTGLMLKSSWVWFWLTAQKWRKNKFKEDLRNFYEFIARHTGITPENQKPAKIKVQQPTILRKPEDLLNIKSQNYSDGISGLRIYSGLQKSATALFNCEENFLRDIFEKLTRKEINHISEEIGNLSSYPPDFKNFLHDTNCYKLSNSEAEEMINAIKSSTTKEPNILNFTPLQKLAVFLSALPSGTSEKMYGQILSEMSKPELEGLTKTSQSKQVISLQKSRCKIIENFMWYTKGSYTSCVPLSETHWQGNLQNIALRSPRKIASALNDIWLSNRILPERFDRFAFQNPNLTSFWIRRYISSNHEINVHLNRMEKAYILFQLIPDELAENIINGLDNTWSRIFKNLPRRRHEITSGSGRAHV
jgi:flagellar motor switch protein FliG